MAYSNKNVIVGAAALYLSVKDSLSEDGWTPSGVALPVGATSPSGISAAKKGAGAFEVAPGSTDWRHVGYTTDGIEVSYEPDYGEVTVDQLLDSAKIFKQGMRVSVNTTLAEATLFNLMVAWGQKGDTVTGATSDTETNLKISGGDLHDDPIERSLAFVGPAPRSTTGNKTEKRERVYHLQRALQVESSAHSLSRSDATTIPVSFRCLPGEASASSGDYGRIIQRVVTSS